jgi:pimeloyl-ACP methyl ester carboxylesterase
MTNTVYVFSGLGADERVFVNIDFAGLHPIFIKWITPQRKESIESYATKLLTQITSEKPVLIGISFGGIMAIEVAKQIETEKVIIISSAKTKNEIPYYLRWAGQLGIHKLFPASLLKQSNIFSSWLFGTTSASEKQLLKEILKDTDVIFLKWAIDCIVHWKNTTLLKNLKHIHGTSDRILPHSFVTCNYSINNGGHFMILNKAEEVTKLIQEFA